MTTGQRQPVLSPLKQIPIQSLMCKTTATSDHFFLSPNYKEACLKQPLKALCGEEMRNKHKEQCIKNKCLSDYIYTIAAL